MTLYFFRIRYAASRCCRDSRAMRRRGPLERVARAVRGVLHARGPARRFRRYLLGLLSDSRPQVDERDAGARAIRVPIKRSSISSPMRRGRPTPCGGTCAPRFPIARGVLILDGTSFPKQGPHSVGVARQYCGALGKIANCQTAVTVALWTGARGVDAGRDAVSPRRVADGPAAHAGPHSAPGPRPAEMAAGAHAAPAGPGERDHGDGRPRRCGVRRECDADNRAQPRLGGLVHAEDLRALVAPAPRTGRGRPRSRPTLAPDVVALEARAWAAAQPARAWRVVRGAMARSPPGGPGSVPGTPAHDWRDRRLAPEVWLLGERALGTSDRTKYYLVHLPATASLRTLVRLTHQRWAIEQQYQELKDELGLDHFEGRMPGWQRHVLLTALAYTWLQCERQRRGTHLPTLRSCAPDHRNPDRSLLRHPSTLSAHHAETGRNSI